jgi:hypothetical protein
MSRMYFFRSSRSSWVSGIGAGRRPHVDAAPAAAEIERHADDVNGPHGRL